MQLTVADGDHQSELIVPGVTQEFDKQNYRFRPRLNENDQPVDEHRIKIPAFKSAPAETTISIAAPGSAESCAPVTADTSSEASMPTQREIAQRELLVQFFRLRTPDRYAAANEAGLLRDGDDTLAPQTMWAEVFRRAVESPDGLSRFWAAVASRNPVLDKSRNPFAA